MKLFVVCALFVAAVLASDLDDNIVEDVSSATSKVNKYVDQVRSRARKYRLRAQKWLEYQEQQQNAFFNKEIEAVGVRVQRFLSEEHSDEEELAFQMAERAKVQRAKEDVLQGLHKAAQDVMQWTESAEHDLEEGLNRATHDLYAGIERARSEKPEDVHSAKEDLLKQVRRATVDIFKGVRQSRKDYRKGIYAARKDLREADDRAHRDLELDE